jgi:exodeoxyribonuclease V alpha subunit
MQQNTPPKDRLAREHVGAVEEIRFHDRDSGHVIAELRDGVVVSGKSDDSRLEEGQQYRFLGQWVDHPKFGPQFRFAAYCLMEPTGRRGAICYLERLCPGVGEKTAAALYDAYAGDTVRVVRTDPERIVRDGFLDHEAARGAAERLKAAEEFEATKVELHGLFHRRGFPAEALIKACVRAWREEAPEFIRQDPFVMLMNNMPGCGFKRCDRLYIELGHDPKALKRQMLAGWSSLRTDGSGHTWFPIEHAVRAINDAIGSGAQPGEAIRMGIAERRLRTRRDEANRLWVAEYRKAGNEQSVADGFARLMRFGRNFWPAAGELAGPSEHQLAKLAMATAGPVGILAGSPGTGKTFTAASLLQRILEKHGNDSTAVAAPTGKAAVRCSQAMRANGVNKTAVTIHKLLRLGAGSSEGGYNSGEPLPFRYIVIDESSMLDTDLAAALVRACADGTHLLLIGDPWQLPPVGHGAPLRDLIAADIPYGELSEIRRNAGLIVHACAAIKDGRDFEVAERYDAAAGQNLRFIQREKPADILGTIQDVLGRFHDNGSFHPVWDVQVIVGVNERGELNRKTLNDTLQAMLNPDGKSAPHNPFRVGDKIICLKNGNQPAVRLSSDIDADPTCVASYTADRSAGGLAREAYVANGEVGRVYAVSESAMIARFDNDGDPDSGSQCVRVGIGRQRDPDDVDDGGVSGNAAEKGRGCNFDLAYAVTAHRMQGSEAPCVIVVVDKGAGAVASREWWYVAISRATKLSIVIGSPELMRRQALRASLRRRKTFLKELFCENLNPVRPEPHLSENPCY